MQGHISGVVDIPNACATLWLPTDIFEFDINPSASGPTRFLDGSIDKAETKTLPIFDFKIPTALPGVDPKILDPRDTYADASQWDEKAKDLASRFVKNFVKYEGNEAGKALVAAGPKAE